MNKIEQAINNLNFMADHKVIHHVDETHEGYICKGINKYEVAIKYDFNNEIMEEFVGIKVLTGKLNQDDSEIPVLYLQADSSIDINKFAYVASNFMDISNRSKLTNNPYLWIDEWKEIFGNSIKSHLITDVLAELFVLKYLLEKGYAAKWDGPNGGTHDIVMDDLVVEVKSTIHKSNKIINVSSSHQLLSDKKEKLAFCRLEEKPYSYSIDSLVVDLVNLNYDINSIESCLAKKGYPKNSRSRRITYDILGLYMYDVNEQNFPIITLEKMNELAPKNNILSYKLSLDLSSIECETIIEK